MIQELLRLLKGMDYTPGDWGSPYFKRTQYYETVPLSADNLSGFELAGGERVVCSVDGGNNTIFESPSESLHLLRVYFNLFRGKKRVQNVEPLSAYLVSKPDGEGVRAEIFPLNSSIPLEERVFVLSADEVNGDGMRNAGHTVRRYLEWLVMKYVCQEYLEEGDILVKDGALQTGVEEERGYAEEVYAGCLDKEVTLVGIAKTSSLMTTTGYPLLAAIRMLADEGKDGRWYYHPIAENKHPDHKGEMHVVKYHPSSDYVFRTEFYREQKFSRQDVLGELALQARDPIFLGYPYGLVDADKRARVTDEEVEYLKTVGMGAMGDSMRYRINSLNAHDILSNI